MSERNKELSRRYHELNPDNFDEILTPDFVGHHCWPENPWTLEDHRRTWMRLQLTDTIHIQIAEGDWVATRFTRMGMFQGRVRRANIMHLKRIRDGKIAELWEYYDRKQVEEDFPEKDPQHAPTTATVVQARGADVLERNKAVSLKYHELDPGNFDEIFVPHFVGHRAWPDDPWNLEDHRRTWTDLRGITDTIHQQVAEGDWVATRSTRRGVFKGKMRQLDQMYFKRFEHGKIAELWSYWNSEQLEAEAPAEAQ